MPDERFQCRVPHARSEPSDAARPTLQGGNVGCKCSGSVSAFPTSRKDRDRSAQMADEPGWDAMINIPTKTSSIVRQRWHTYLQAQGLTPNDFGATSWSSVVPDTGRGDAGAGNTSAAGNPLELPARKLFYWSIRFAHWDSCRYMGEWTAALQKASGDPDLQTYVNWNNFDGRMYVFLTRPFEQPCRGMLHRQQVRAGDSDPRHRPQPPDRRHGEDVLRSAPLPALLALRIAAPTLPAVTNRLVRMGKNEGRLDALD